MFGPPARTINPDPILTGVMVDNSSLGGWLAPVLCPVRPVAKDYVRWGKENAQSLLSNLMRTVRAPGDMPQLLERSTREWLTSIVLEDAVRIEYSEEDVQNSLNPLTEPMAAAKKILNVLQYATELRVATLFDPSGFAAANKAAASAPWAGASGTAIEEEMDAAEIKVLELTGLAANYVRIPRKKWGGIKASGEIVKLRTGQDPIEYVNGQPMRFFGKRILFGLPRWDTAPTGTFTPAFLWETASLNLDDTVHVGYSPTLDGGTWNGNDPTFIGQFENQMGGTAYAAQHMLDPLYQQNKKHHVWGNVRRSLPEVFNADAVFAITGI